MENALDLFFHLILDKKLVVLAVGADIFCSHSQQSILTLLFPQV